MKTLYLTKLNIFYKGGSDEEELDVNGYQEEIEEEE